MKFNVSKASDWYYEDVVEINTFEEMKAYTDIEQSRRLLELGIPAESADGFYEAQRNPFTSEWEDILFVGTKWADKRVVTPAWSLAALLELMPDTISITVGTLSNGNKYYYCDAYDYLTPVHDTPIGAAVGMVCWLKENKYI